MGTTTKRIATATLTGGVVLGGLLLTGGAASAMPSDQPCTPSDVVTSVTADPSHAAGQEAFVLTYTAASPTTNCKLQGVPTAVTFTKGSGHSVADGSDTVVTPDGSATGAAPVNLRAGHPAESRILQQAAAAPTFLPDVVNLNLPTGPQGSSVTVAWPAGAPLKGHTAHVTAVSPAPGS
jgi:hypothetical protein